MVSADLPSWTVQPSKNVHDPSPDYYLNTANGKSFWRDPALPRGWGYELRGKERVYISLATGAMSEEVPVAAEVGEAKVGRGVLTEGEVLVALLLTLFFAEVMRILGGFVCRVGMRVGLRAAAAGLQKVCPRLCGGCIDWCRTNELMPVAVEEEGGGRGGGREGGREGGGEEDEFGLRYEEEEEGGSLLEQEERQRQQEEQEEQEEERRWREREQQREEARERRPRKSSLKESVCGLTETDYQVMRLTISAPLRIHHPAPSPPLHHSPLPSSYPPLLCHSPLLFILLSSLSPSPLLLPGHPAQSSRRLGSEGAG
jgi:hypothetical protein